MWRNKFRKSFWEPEQNPAGPHESHAEQDCNKWEKAVLPERVKRKTKQ